MNAHFENASFGEVGYAKTQQLWNEKTGKFIIWQNRSSVKLWNLIDYSSIFAEDTTDIGRLFLLIHNIDYDNYVCCRDKHSHRQVPINSNEHLMSLLNIKSRYTFKKFIDKLLKNDILAVTHITDYDNKKYKRFVINPLCGMKSNGISPSLYKLFHESIAPLIGNHARTCLATLVAEQEGNSISLIEDTPPVINPIDVFRKYVLRGSEPMTYAKKNTGMVASEINLENDIYFSVNGTVEYLPKKPSNSDIIDFRNWFIDIDAGKDKNGNYFSDEEVLIRKQYMCKTVLKSIPTPTLVVETRNGYHIYWSCVSNISADDWNRIEQKIHDIISVADHAVKDASRILRMPNTMWLKPGKGCAPFEVKAVSSAPIQYGVEDFEAILNSHAEKIASACRTYTSKYQIIDKNRSSKPSLKRKIAPRVIKQSLDIKKTITDSNIARDIARSIDITDWLKIANPKSFRCILPEHEDKHPSASIYRNNDHERYLCHCCNDGHGLDSIDLARRLYGFSYQEAVEYLCNLQGFDYKAKQRKIA